MESEFRIQETCQDKITKYEGTCKNFQCEDDNSIVIEKGLDVYRIQEHEPAGRRIVDDNLSIKTGSITTGIGYAQLEELCAAVNMPCMSEKTYINRRDTLVDDFLNTAMQSMKMAGEEEKQLAIEEMKL
ncbi:hypothetical protein X777_15129 [Ooceraea biroi]|uniref:Mutator-like transposase domain-containing protein n=1 Tax=Ooceraea biroi TaxID=2015173 RepID=A0A026VVW5_OOCBI|nr:hypothetical protein X777_15129 [Ooceraea biroi]